MASAISSSVPTRPMGTGANIGSTACSISVHGAFAASPWLTATFQKASSRLALWIVPGETVFTMIPSIATALASETVIAIMAALAAA